MLYRSQIPEENVMKTTSAQYKINITTVCRILHDKKNFLIYTTHFVLCMYYWFSYINNSTWGNLNPSPKHDTEAAFMGT
jgi:hypothetical protein